MAGVKNFAIVWGFDYKKPLPSPLLQGEGDFIVNVWLFKNDFETALLKLSNDQMTPSAKIKKENLSVSRSLVTDLIY